MGEPFLMPLPVLSVHCRPASLDLGYSGDPSLNSWTCWCGSKAQRSLFSLLLFHRQLLVVPSLILFAGRNLHNKRLIIFL